MILLESLSYTKISTVKNGTIADFKTEKKVLTFYVLSKLYMLTLS